MSSIKNPENKKDLKNLRDIVAVSSLKADAFPLVVDYEGLLLKMSQKGIQYLMVFRKSGDILTIGNTPVVKFVVKNFQDLDKTEGAFTLDRIPSKKSPTGFTIVVLSWVVSRKEPVSRVQITFADN